MTEQSADKAPAFTKGPLEAVEYASPQGRWFIRPVGGGKTINYPLGKGDAHLFAAAPDLYEALAGALDTLTATDGHVTDPTYRDGWSDAAAYETYMAGRTALAKALGHSA